MKTLDEIRHDLMAKEMTNDGWDLRDELLALVVVVAWLADRVEVLEDTSVPHEELVAVKARLQDLEDAPR